MATAAQIEAYGKADDDELSAAMDRCDTAIDARFAEHVTRVKETLRLSGSFYNPERREHVSSQDGATVASDTRVFWSDELKPLLVATVLREVNHTLLTVIDRSGAKPAVFEDSFDTRDYM